MTVEQVIQARLVGFVGLTALVSTRIHPNYAPQNTARPYVAYRRVSTPRPRGFGEATGLVGPARFQFDAFSETYVSVRAVAAQLTLALNEWRAPSASPEILDSFVDNDLDLYEPETGLHHAVVDVMLTYRE